MEYEKLITQLRVHEGDEHKVYRCSEGYLTIGVGRNLETNGITQEESDFLLANDLSRVEKQVRKHIRLHGLNDARIAVLINMAFNLGINGLRKFKKTLAYIEQGDFETASTEMLDSKWRNQVGYRAIQLAEQLRTGEWQ
ncbi:glycoside hydrolase family protein [Alteromonas sp. P256]|uniref:glycoside hydrolase family protein n=1 Tax=Alteromonas sp. P256 TaxID=3117399 RepID=UPI002FE0DE3B